MVGGCLLVTRIHPDLEEPGQALDVVAGGHHGHGHRRSGLSNGR